MSEREESPRAVASELTMYWGPGEMFKSIRRLSLEAVSVQAELIAALQRESRELENKIKSVELERNVNADRIKELEKEASPDTEESVSCENCYGSGIEPKSAGIPCRVCHGGEVAS